MVSTKKSTSVDDIELQNVRGKDNRTCSAEPSNGCYVTRIKGVLLVCVFVGVAALVGVVVHYAAPKAVVECICGYPDQSRDTWLQCQQHVSDRNMCAYFILHAKQYLNKTHYVLDKFVAILRSCACNEMI